MNSSFVYINKFAQNSVPNKTSVCHGSEYALNWYSHSDSVSIIGDIDVELTSQDVRIISVVFEIILRNQLYHSDNEGWPICRSNILLMVEEISSRHNHNGLNISSWTISLWTSNIADLMLCIADVYQVDIMDWNSRSTIGFSFIFSRFRAVKSE